jgi:hypothetical protein
MGVHLCLLLSLAPALSPTDEEVVVAERVDLIEVNHFYDHCGRLVLDQVIFYDWCDRDCRFQVRAWRLLKQAVQVPHERTAHGDFVTIWQDGDVLRKVATPSFQESWTQHDPEQLERRLLPQTNRRELCKPCDGSQ